MLLKPDSCSAVKLEIGVYLAASVHISVFVMLLLHYIKLGRCFGSCGMFIGFFYLYVIGAMVGVQIFMYKGDMCYRAAPVLYYWLGINVMLFYFLIALYLNLWGAYVCWVMDQEVEETDQAMKAYVAKNKGEMKGDELMMIKEMGYDT